MALLNDMHDMATDQNVQFMEYEAYHCLDLIAPRCPILTIQMKCAPQWFYSKSL